MNEITTLLLAWHMAIKYDKDESKAIYLCANKIWQQVEDPVVRSMIIKLGQRKTPDADRIKTVQKLEFGLRKENILKTLTT